MPVYKRLGDSQIRNRQTANAGQAKTNNKHAASSLCGGALWNTRSLHMAGSVVTTNAAPYIRYIVVTVCIAPSKSHEHTLA